MDYLKGLRLDKYFEADSTSQECDKHCIGCISQDFRLLRGRREGLTAIIRRAEG